MSGKRWVLSMAAMSLGCLAGGLVRAATPSYVYFFTAVHDHYLAYLDTNNVTTDGLGFKLVSVKITNFSDDWRPWIEKNFPGAEKAAYAIDPYSIDCSMKTIGEHRLVWYDSDDNPMANYDFGGKMAPSIADTMKDHLMDKVCGF